MQGSSFFRYERKQVSMHFQWLQLHCSPGITGNLLYHLLLQVDLAVSFEWGFVLSWNKTQSYSAVLLFAEPSADACDQCRSQHDLHTDPDTEHQFHPIHRNLSP